MDGVVVSGTMRSRAGGRQDRRSSRTFQASVDDGESQAGHAPTLTLTLTPLSSPDAETAEAGHATHGHYSIPGRRRTKKRLSLPRVKVGSKLLSRLPSVSVRRRGSVGGRRGGGRRKKGGSDGNGNEVSEMDEACAAAAAQVQHESDSDSDNNINKGHGKGSGSGDIGSSNVPAVHVHPRSEPQKPQSVLEGVVVINTVLLNDTEGSIGGDNDMIVNTVPLNDTDGGGPGNDNDTSMMGVHQRRKQFSNRRGSFGQTSEASLTGSFALRTGTRTKPTTKTRTHTTLMLSKRRLVGENNTSQCNNSSKSLASNGSASAANQHNPSAHPFLKRHESHGSLLDLTVEDIHDPYCPSVGDDVYERSRRIHRRTSYECRRSSERRTSIDLAKLIEADSFRDLVRSERWMDWASSVRRLDPRYQILTYFDDVARDGGILRGIAARSASERAASVVSASGSFGASIAASTYASATDSRNGGPQRLASLLDCASLESSSVHLDGSCRSQARSVLSVASAASSGDAHSVHSMAARMYDETGRDEDLDVVARSVARHFSGNGGNGGNDGNNGDGGNGDGKFISTFRRLSLRLTDSRRGSMTSVIEEPRAGDNYDNYDNYVSSDGGGGGGGGTGAGATPSGKSARRTRRSWSDRAADSERVPPPGVQAWGPSGAVSSSSSSSSASSAKATTDARSYAASLAREEIEDATMDYKDAMEVVREWEENVIVLKADVDLERRRLSDRSRLTPSEVRDRLRSVRARADDASRELRLARNDARRCDDAVRALEERHWSLLSVELEMEMEEEEEGRDGGDRKGEGRDEE
uniref:Uncharacterized protein n=1 Tax=Odontella aurita TaxID=265563 RepID=A0A7S4J869_9STRA